MDLSSNDAAASAVAAVANAISIDPEVIDQMKQSAAHGDNITQNLEEVLKNHQVEAEAAAAVAAVAAVNSQNGSNKDDGGKIHQRILPRSKLNRPFELDPELNMNLVDQQQHQSQQQQHMHQHQQHQQQMSQQVQQLHHAQHLHDEQFARVINTECSRCKKTFSTPIHEKVYKLCDHCRALQRERSRRWQSKTKTKPSLCRRCGQAIPDEARQYVLCPSCRMSLRTRKANRAAQGKCVHCSGPNDSPNNEFKVCQRCRSNDKMRRDKLEQEGACNRCAKPLSDEDLNSYKVCSRCRNRKKRVTSISHVSGSVRGGNNSGYDGLVDASTLAATYGWNMSQFNSLSPEVQSQLTQSFLQREQQQQRSVQQQQVQQIPSQISQQPQQQSQQISQQIPQAQQAHLLKQDSNGDNGRSQDHGNERYTMSTENFVQQLQSASNYANAALGSRDKGMKGDKDDVDVNNNLFLNPEGENAKKDKI